MNETLAFALAAGALAAVNPCGFAMLPAYLTLFIAQSSTGGTPSARLAALGRALAATAAMTAGFLAVFGIFGLALAPIASTVQRWLPTVTIVIGAALLLLGIFMLTGRNVLLRTPKLQATKNPVAGLGSMALYGVSYAIASLGCTIGPFLVVTTTTFKAGDITTGIAAYAAYAAGMGLVVGVLAVAAALAQQSAARLLRTVLPHITRIGGGLLVLVGAYIAWYGVYELRLYAGASPDDPIVTAASGIQNTLAGWVDHLGPAPFALTLLALAALAGGAALLARHRSHNRTRSRPTEDTGPGPQAAS
ncbi:cytochrome c biogenesis CcdA family protein [Streptomyces sp. DSM 116496]|uniref:cytochrome c biogenesis CcdA family protein n=1 Tax=Streptomyces stoeckheimensis TaxID=3344656 RepID=UPI0038B3D454